MICRLCVVKRIEFVVPICLTSGAYTMYQQLSEERNNGFGCIKADSFTEYERHDI